VANRKGELSSNPDGSESASQVPRRGDFVGRIMPSLFG
jgi:hypothetical protein